ncbi:UDP-galactose phosphate transferase [Pseudalgibacter alginicilyticus]|uniref:UDP-galactose phosphate transferase n=1 Tax=Pseudalgibacter alginicilyticus TaxID=1736674 RepID=A0A0P0D079_9FLAO|nr:sugar transferase [Pseudalgibacter alginicilyticus]ALJ04044.1 UDP-galactose phosphate transferase [Pseudalgibacter alginicilyticus]
MYKVTKRFIDFFSALIVFIFLFPIFLTTLICLFVVNNGKPFFLQERPGKNGKIFKIIKFKTMRDLKPNQNTDIHNLNRVTKIGHFIRTYSLDEIPQLINVIKGDMSIVGPRPLLPSYLPLYNDFQKQRHNVKPGITGWAQVKGRNAISWELKFEYDVWYVKHSSLLLDLKIILLTIKRIIVPEGINTNEGANMPEFTGSQKENNT